MGGSKMSQHVFRAYFDAECDITNTAATSPKVNVWKGQPASISGQNSRKVKYNDDARFGGLTYKEPRTAEV
ncbi:hypothetical protein PoB_006378100 [Plakobranchus ocellatus]|uniref:Uncharacterized protein n=1 Tax=Plakobranchus ocellatus TaxID=259542 RepID=A0AAV4CZX2_9GAST|nr:hypothetical protein PoB_006378100 [Plakobranchus ocellatus]